MFHVERNVAYGQWKGCLFLHVGATAFLMQLSRAGHWSVGFELLTPSRWFAFRPFRRLTWRRA